MVHIPMAMASPPQAATSERDLRLDLFRGVALWLIFLDHIPENIVNWFTIRNYGFSDATEIFIFISGYTAAFVYGRTMRERGFMLSSARILRRAWQIYVAHIFLFTIFMAEIAYVAATFDNPLYAEEMKILDFLKQPDITIFQALLLKFKPVNMDVLPLYIVLLLMFPPMLFLLLRAPNVALAGSAVVYALTWKLDWNLPAYPNGVWFFNPFAWQLLFVFGAWCALGGSHRLAGFLRSRIVLAVAIAYLVFAFAITLTWHFEALDRFRADLAGGVDVSHRQDQSRRAALRAFPGACGGDRPLHPAPLVRPEIGDPATRHPLRSALARDFLSRRVSGLCRTVHYRGILGRPAAADRYQRVRHYRYDRYRQPHIVVQRHRRAKPPIARQITRRRPRGRRGMTFIIAVLTTIALLNGAAMAAAEPPAAPCDVPEWLLPADADLTHVSNEIKDRHRLDISVVGSGSSALSGPDGARFAYPAQLEQSLKERVPGLEIKVTAHVQSRQTTADMASGLQKILTEDQPALVIWQAGTVDALRGVEPEDFRTSLDQGIDIVTAAHADVIMMNMQHSPRTESMLGVSAYADVMRWVAEQHGVVLFDRLAIMRYWSDEGVFDLYAATKDYAMARRVHECIGRALASLIINSGHLDAGKIQTTH